MTNSYKADTTNNTVNEYFDLHTTGVGYVNRIREVTPKQGDAFMACTIGALRGSKSAVEYSYFDCRVSGAEASKVIRRLDKACEESKQILIGFKIGDQYSESFVYKSGSKKGETGICTKAHLLFISWVKIEGDSVYTAPIKSEAIETDENGVVPDTQEPVAA
ncbi:MAG: DUF3577 domain-containing protein [Gammaproteobacteria bacterium]|nr:DUF3577 domain-containing protein [Gammaproteobacteria bacterium]MBT6419923.1 DUF3577 domain-containing protein [Gammaproteobacteria bacterium]MBT6575699.1 DUF3577 domain-containing protein [Gammaproteobacteria bacterium]